MSEDVLSEAFFDARERDLEQRLKRKRFEHARSVSEMAALLAETYGADVRKARLAGLLHDWDKEYDDDAIRAHARALDVDVDPYVLETMPRLLHGPTAAAELKRAHPDLPDDVIQSIARHTAAAVGMSDLDMIIYIADAIEPGRDFDGLDELRSAIGASRCIRFHLKGCAGRTMAKVQSSHLYLQSRRRVKDIGKIFVFHAWYIS